MGLIKIEELASIIGSNPINFQVQTSTILAYVETRMGSIGQEFCGAGQTYMAWGISTKILLGISFQILGLYCIDTT